VGRQVPRGDHDGADRERVAAREEDASGAEARVIEQLDRLGLTGGIVQITGGQADNGVAAQLSEADGHFFILAESHHEGVPRGVFQRYRSDSHGQRLAEKRARRLDDSLTSCADSAPGAGAVSRISAIIADAASAIVTALDRSPAAIAWGREIGTTAATPAHLRSAVILWPTGCATGITGPYDKPLSDPLRGSGKEPRPDSEG